MHCLRKHNKMSGGFPHSDIHGSKPIPGSPWLNAGYHVLHRLLLPRHPPNALFALDLIQKEQGSFRLPSSWKTAYQKHVLSHPSNPERLPAVSVLDLEQYRSTQPKQRMQHCKDPMFPILGQHQTILMFLSIYDVKATVLRTATTSEEQTIKHIKQMSLMIHSSSDDGGGA